MKNLLTLFITLGFILGIAACESRQDRNDAEEMEQDTTLENEGVY